MGVGKMQIQAVTKGYRLIRDNKTKVITASNVWIYIYIYICEHVFWILFL